MPLEVEDATPQARGELIGPFLSDEQFARIDPPGLGPRYATAGAFEIIHKDMEDPTVYEELKNKCEIECLLTCNLQRGINAKQKTKCPNYKRRLNTNVYDDYGFCLTVCRKHRFVKCSHCSTGYIVRNFLPEPGNPPPILRTPSKAREDYEQSSEFREWANKFYGNDGYCYVTNKFEHRRAYSEAYTCRYCRITTRKYSSCQDCYRFKCKHCGQAAQYKPDGYTPASTVVNSSIPSSRSLSPIDPQDASPRPTPSHSEGGAATAARERVEPPSESAHPEESSGVQRSMGGQIEPRPSSVNLEEDSDDKADDGIDEAGLVKLDGVYIYDEDIQKREDESVENRKRARSNTPPGGEGSGGSGDNAVASGLTADGTVGDAQRVRGKEDPPATEPKRKKLSLGDVLNSVSNP